MAYRFNNKQKTLALGVFPVVTLARARESALEAKRLLHEGIDPNVHKKQLKAASGSNTFEALSEEWQKKESGRWSEGHADKVRQTLRVDALPHLRNIPINDIKTSDVLHVIRKIEERGALDVAARVKQRISAIFRYAIQTGYVEYNPVDALKDVLKTRKVKHRQSIKPDQFPHYLVALDNYQGYEVTKYALQFITHTFVRPGELRSAEWKDFDIKNAIWRIPSQKMKIKDGDDHVGSIISVIFTYSENG